MSGVLNFSIGTGTFITTKKPDRSEVERRRQLDALVNDFLSRVGAAGFRLEEILCALQEHQEERSR